VAGGPDQRFLLARSGPELLGCIGLELHGADGLLRSFAVAPAQRRRGLGAALHDRAVKEAAVLGVRRLFLLTTTVRERALRLGFSDLPRELLPPSIRDGAQARSLCPASAACMMLRIA